jgi:hypothetical protein
MNTNRVVRFCTCYIVLTGAVTLGAAESKDSATLIPPVNFAPGAEYGDDVRMFQGIASLEQSPNGRLWAMWYGGGVTEDHHNYIMVVTSGDDGRTWSDLKLVIDPDRDGPVRAFDPCPWLDPNGQLWLFWSHRSNGLPYLFAMTTQNPDDENPEWSKPRLIGEGIMMCKPTVTSAGDWLLPTAIWQRDGSCRVVVSIDQGKTWALRGTATIRDPKERNCDEPMIVERRDGSLWMWIRTRYGIGHSNSTDAGRTWSDVVPSNVVHPVARFFVRRLKTGNLLLVKHGPMDARTGRSHLTAYVSKDDGETWDGGLLLDARNGVSYPDGFQKDDGRIYIIHDFDRTRTKEILMSVFTEEDALAGKDVSNKVRLRVLINQATGQNPGRKPVPAEVTLNQHSDGAEPLEGVGAELKSRKDDESSTVFCNGAELFTDRTYVAENLPDLLKSRKFVCASIDGTSVEATRDGVVLAITPLPNRNRDSVAAELVKQGFEKVAQPEFRLFGSNANICTTFQKRVEAGDVISIAKWGVLIY